MSLRIDETVAHNLKAIRISHHLTQQSLADLANVSKQTISNLEKGQGATSKTIERLAECLDVSPLAFYQEVTNADDIQFKRVSSTGTSKLGKFTYVNELNRIANTIVDDTKQIIYYQQVTPVIKAFFNDNTDTILDSLNASKSNENYRVIATLQKELIANIREAIYSNAEELDELIE